MLKRLLSPFLLLLLVVAGCQAPQGKFTPEQIAAMKSYGFTEASGDWSLGLSDMSGRSARSDLHREALDAVHEVRAQVVDLAVAHEVDITGKQVLEHHADLESGE